MATEQEKGRMGSSEIRELLDLRKWRKENLALFLGMGTSIVEKWLKGERTPGPAASRLIELELQAARSGKRLVGDKSA